jgi:hypothetical protein
MPPRWVSAVIIAGWIASVVWLFRLEIWPSLEPGAPPPFTIDLVDEAQTTTNQAIRWGVTQNGHDTFLVARTSVEHRAKENDFTLRADFTSPESRDRPPAADAQKITIRRMSSAYRVTPEGQLLDLEVAMGFFYKPTKLDCDMRVSGAVRNGQFVPRYEITSPYPLSFSLPPVAVSSQGSVVMPLHPVNKIGGLKPGQQWRVPVFDPVSDSMASMTGGAGEVRFLRAKVRPQTETLHWNNADTPCLVIDYQEENERREDKMTAETWVRAADGLVIKQIADISGTRWEMTREDYASAH